MKGDNFIFRVADGTVKTPGRNRRLKPPTLIRDHPERGEEQEILQGKSDGLSFPTPHQDESTLDGAEAKNDFWSITGDIICRHHEERAERRIISCLIEVHRRYQKYTYIIGCIIGENIDDYWNVDGEREFLLNEGPPDGYAWCGRRLTRKQTTSRPDTVWPHMWKHMSDASKRKEEQKWAIEKPKLDNARRLRGIYFIAPEDEEFKDITKKARRKLEIPMPAAKELAPHRYHEDHTAAEGINLMSRYNLVHQFIPMPQTLKIPDARVAVEKIMGTTLENTSMAADRSQKQK